MAFKKYISPSWYAVIDFFTASIAWAAFYFLRKIILHEAYSIDHKFWLGIIFIPVGWLVLYGLTGAYRSVYAKSRLAEITSTFICTVIGCTALFFLFLLDDAKTGYRYYYKGFFSLFALHFFATGFGRLVILGVAKSQLVKKHIQFNALLAGSIAPVQRVYKEAKLSLAAEGYRIVGYVSPRSDKQSPLHELTHIGLLEELEAVVENQK
ncbi:MAG TPA: hypothetical protein VM871_00905, partial [Flavisolibacter sp.]|nr:hypothetical protein [Flavisolibacter sp.]